MTGRLKFACSLLRVFRLPALLERVGCALTLDEGDVVFFAEDVYHRTQDLLAERVALLVNVE